MIATVIAQMCVALCSAALTIHGNPVPYTPYATHGVYLNGQPVGVEVDDTQRIWTGHSECQDVALDRQHWSLVIAAIAPEGQNCTDATYNAREWGQYWGHLPRASAYVLESYNLGPLTRPAPMMTRRAFGYHPALIIFYR